MPGFFPIRALGNAKVSLISAALFAAFCPSAFAGAPAPDTAVLELPESTVQASRKAKTPDKLPQKVEVITARDIDLTPADDLTDLLKKSTSIDVVQYPGLLSGVGMRGFRPQFSGLNQRTLLLVDGRPAGATNYAAMDLLPVDRVEIIKGPFSALYGAQAMGGVINVVPRRSRGRVTTQAKVGTGSFGRFQGAVVSGGNLSERMNYDLALHAFTLSRDVRIGREHSLSNLGLVEDNSPTLKPVGGSEEKVLEPGDGQLRPNTKYEEQGGVLRLGWDLDENWSLETRADLYDAPNVENPGDIYYGVSQPGRKNVERFGGEARLKGSIGHHDILLQSYRSREYGENFNIAGNFKSSESTLDFMGAGLRDNYAWRSHTFTAGVEYQNRSTEGRNWSSAVAAQAPFRPDYGISNASIYGEAYLSFLRERLIGTLGIRYDRIAFEVLRTDLLTSYQPGTEDYHVVSPSAGLLYRFDCGIRLRSTAGQGFVTPDAFQVAGYSESFKGSGRVAVSSGNPDLDPEQNLTVDGGVGFEKPSLGLSMDLTYFHTEVENRIAARTVSRPALPLEIIDGDTLTSRTTFVNANASRMRGLEMRLSSDAGPFFHWNRSLRVFANSTWMLEAVDETVVRSRDGLRDSSTLEADIKNVGKVNATFGIEYDDRTFLATRLSGRYLGKRLDTEFNDPRFPDIEYPRFLLFDVSAQLRLGPQNGISLAVSNVTNENYYEKRGFNLPGRDYRVGYSRTFQ